MEYSKEFSRLDKDKDIIEQMESLYTKLSKSTRAADEGRVIRNGLDDLASYVSHETATLAASFNEGLHKAFQGDFELVDKLVRGKISVDEFIQAKVGSDDD